MRISDWSSDVCSSDLGPVPRTPRCAVRNRSRDQRSAAEAEEGQEEAGGGESDRQAEDDLDQAPEAAGRLAKCEGQAGDDDDYHRDDLRSEEHTSELQSLMRISYAVFCLKKKKQRHYKQ